MHVPFLWTGRARAREFLLRLVPAAIRCGADLVNPARDALEGVRREKCDSILFAFHFSRLPWGEGQAALRLAAACARRVHVADFRLAERNLELPQEILSRLLCAGNRQFWQMGALENFCLLSGLEARGRQLIMARMAALVTLAGNNADLP